MREGDGAIERFEALLKETERIKDILTTYVDRIQAHELAQTFFNYAEELDRIAEEITSHQAIYGVYTYNGVFFELKSPTRWCICVSYDGLHFLKALGDNNIEPFFCHNWGDHAFERWVEKHFLHIPRVRRAILQEEGRIEFFSDETLRDMVNVKIEQPKASHKKKEGEPIDDFLSGWDQEMEEWKKKNKI